MDPDFESATVIPENSLHTYDVTTETRHVTLVTSYLIGLMNDMTVVRLSKTVDTNDSLQVL